MDTAKALELFRNNRNCRLPCWWGITPGQTSAETMPAVLYEFGLSYGCNTMSGLAVAINMNDVPVSFGVKIDTEDNATAMVRGLEVSYGTAGSSGILQEIPFYSDLSYPALPGLLSTYGPPAQVHFSFDDDPRSVQVFILILDYSKSGWSAVLRMPLNRNEGTVGGCPVKASATLRLWSPGDIDQQNLGLSDGLIYKTLEEATGMTVEELYERYKDPTYSKCLEVHEDVFQR
jgi:hypothetical protein